jgi:hypothetical protein
MERCVNVSTCSLGVPGPFVTSVLIQRRGASDEMHDKGHEQQHEEYEEDGEVPLEPSLQIIRHRAARLPKNFRILGEAQQIIPLDGHLCGVKLNGLHFQIT